MPAQKKLTASLININTEVVYHICGSVMYLLEKIFVIGAGAVSLDSPEAGVDLPESAIKIPGEMVILGNINTTGKILIREPEEFEDEVHRLLGKIDPYPDFVLSTGCDLPRETPEENISAFMKAGRSYKPN